MKKVRIDLLFWVLYFGFCYLSDEVLYPKSYLGGEVAIFLSHNVLLFYGLYYCLIKFSKQSISSIAIGILRFILLVFIFFVIRYYIRLKLLPYYYGDAYGEMNIHQWFTTGVIWVVNYFFFASAYYYFSSSRNKQSRVNQLIQQALEREKEKLKLENSFLRSQINPHFLYNTLNFFYAKALPLSNTLSEGIMKLSEIMRYSLRKPDDDGFVSLNEELENIQSTFELARLRYNSKFYLNADFDVFEDNIRVIPLLFITLVENMLKHGELTNSATPAKISIKLIESSTISFSATNAKRGTVAEKSTGIGLANTEARLIEAYGANNFQIVIREDEFMYHISVTIPVVKL